MASKPSNSEATRVDALEALLDAALSRIAQLEADGRQMRFYLHQLGGSGVVIDPKRREPKMTPEQRRALRQQTARAARAAKPVGKGQGAVRSAATKKKLTKEAR